MFPNVSGGAGGLSSDSTAVSRSGDATGRTGAASFNFDFGGNPNAGNNTIIYLSIAALAGLYIWKSRK